jgi:hypothetical protein
MSAKNIDQIRFFPQQSAAALPTKYAAGLWDAPLTVWRALRDGRLEYLMVAKSVFSHPSCGEMFFRKTAATQISRTGVMLARA